MDLEALQEKWDRYRKAMLDKLEQTCVIEEEETS